MGQKRNYYYGIDLIRFAAAMMVAFFHIGFSCWASPNSGGAKIHANSYTLPELASYTWFGWTGVEIFFVISGLVIANSAGKSSASQFAWGRAARLYPAAWVCATFTALLLFSEGHSGVLRRLLLSLVLLPTGPWIDGQYWTLGVEIVFYCVVFAMIVAKLQRHFAILAASLILLSFVANLAATLDPSWTFLGVGKWRLLLLTYGAYFGIGIILQQGISSRWSVSQSAVIIIGLITAILETRLHALGMSNRVTNSPVTLADRWYIASAVTLLGIGLIAFSVYRSRIFDRLPAGALGFIRQLGLATYPLYLVHFSVGIYSVRMLVTRAGLDPSLALIIVIGVLAAVSWLIAAFVEPPLRSILYRARAMTEPRGALVNIGR